MIDRNVSVDFSVDGAEYGASLQQMIAVTQQYNQSADTMIGKVNKMSGFITNRLMKATGGLTAANKLATAQAAAYQQKMTNLETTSKVLGDKTFPKLEKATMKLAREFPIGIGQAVDQMESLNKTGITSVDTMIKLSKSYTQLGAATKSYGPAIGEAMTAFSRTMGSNLSTIQDTSDSLTTLTKKYGGSAESVLAFSKNIAPIASTIGMNKTQVLGLSTAFARLDEDGFAAANAMNKVMIDLNRAVKDGGPELRAYANAMNKTVEELRVQLDTDPASVLVDFTQSINKEGSNAIRTLETLGIEGVRTVKAFTSLSREGNLGEIMATSAEAYGSGSTAEAAESALSGVNDQMSMLGETTSQMVASAGKPFLNWLEMVLGAANKVSGVFADIAASDFMQKTAQVGAVASQGAGMAMSAVSMAGTYALGARLFRGAGNVRQQFREGRQFGALDAMGIGMAGTSAPETAAGRAGARYGERVGAAEPRGRRMDAWRLAKGAGLTGKDLLTWGSTFLASDMRTAVGKEGLTTAGGQRIMGVGGQAWAMAKAGDVAGGSKQLAEAIEKVGKESATTGKAFGSLKGAMANLGVATVQTGGAALKAGGKGALGLLGALGLSGPMAGIAGAGAVGYAGWKYMENQRSDLKAMQGATSDPFGTFNKFAEKAGYATESITLLGEAARDSAKAIADKTTKETEFTLTEEERLAAVAPGYEAAYTAGGQKSATDEALKWFMSNQNASMSETKRVAIDLQSQGMNGQVFLDAVKELKTGGLTPEQVAQKGTALQLQEQNFAGMETDASREAAVQTAEYFTQRWGRTGEQQSAPARERQKEQDLASLYKEATEANSEERDKYIDLISSLSGIEADAVREQLNKSGSERSAAAVQSWAPEYTGTSLGPQAPKTEEPKPEVTAGKSWDELLAEQAAGGNTNAESLAKAAADREAGVAISKEENKVRTQQFEQNKIANEATGATTNLAETLNKANDLAIDQGKTLDELDKNIEGLTAVERAVMKAQQTPGDVNAVMSAGRMVGAQTFAQTGGRLGATQNQLLQQLALAKDDGTKQLLQQALGGLGSNYAVVQQTAGQAPIEGIRQKIEAGRIARLTPLPESAGTEAVQAREQLMAGETQGMAEIADVTRNFLMQVRNTGIQIQQQDADMAKQRGRMAADFRRQQKWAQEDYHHTVLMANKQFGLSMARGEEDYFKTRARANRDFAKSMSRNSESYLRQRNRTQEDYDKQMTRQIEDSAKAMYEPYQRVEHKRVWDTQQLVTNMKQQNQILRRQMEEVDKLKKMGLSQEAVDIFGLANPENAQQTFRMMGEMLNDPKLIGQLNQQVSGRIDLSTMFAIDPDNVAGRRQAEDFKTGLDRMSEDFKISTEQARTDFNTQMEDMATDFAQQRKRAREDFDTQMSEMEYQFDKSTSRARKQQRTNLGRMAADAATARSRMISALARSADDMFTDLETLADETGTYIAGMPTEHKDSLTTSVDVLMTEYEKAIGKHDDDLQDAVDDVTPEMEIPIKFKLPGTDILRSIGDTIGRIFPGGGTDDPNEFWGDLAEKSWKTPAEQAAADAKAGAGKDKTSSEGPTNGVGHYSGNWRNYRSGKFHGGADIAAPYGTPTYAVVNGVVKYTKRMATSYGIHALISDGKHDFLYGHMSALTVNAGDRVKDGTQVGRVGSTGNSTGNHLHFEVRPAGKGHGSAVNPAPWLKDGGVVTKHMQPHVGEAGPEAVIPLNQRGISAMAEAMIKYVDVVEMKRSRTSAYSTVVVNNATVNNDYSSNFNGPVKVEASDPAQLARQLKAAVRLKRLAQPFSGGNQ